MKTKKYSKQLSNAILCVTITKLIIYKKHHIEYFDDKKNEDTKKFKTTAAKKE